MWVNAVWNRSNLTTTHTHVAPMIDHPLSAVLPLLAHCIELFLGGACIAPGLLKLALRHSQTLFHSLQSANTPHDNLMWSTSSSSNTQLSSACTLGVSLSLSVVSLASLSANSFSM